MTVFATFDPGLPSVTQRFTLSGGELVVTGQNGTTPAYSNANPALCQSNIGIKPNTGLFYFEFQINGTAFNAVGGIGLTPPQGLGAGLGFGFNFSGSGVGYFSNGHLFINGGALTAGSPYGPGNSPGVSGDIMGVAVDSTNKTCWFRMNGGQWLGNSGVTALANPATNTQGIDLSTSFAFGRLFPAIQMVDGATNSITANFGATAYTHTPPSGAQNIVQVDTAFGSLWTDSQGQTGAIPAGGIDSAVTLLVCPAVGGVINSVIGQPSGAVTGGAIHTSISIYDDTGSAFTGSAGALLGSSTAVTNIPEGEMTFVFSPPIAFAAGQTLWIGPLCDGGGGNAYRANVNLSNTANSGSCLDAAAVFPTPSNPFNFNSSVNHQVPFLVEYTPASINDAAIAQTLFGPTQSVHTALTKNAAIAQTLGRVTQAAVINDSENRAVIAQTLGGPTQHLAAFDLTAIPKLRQLWAF